MTAEEKTDILEAKRRAKAEVLAYRDRLQAEREAKARAEETADAEIARKVLAKREDEAKQVAVRAELDRMLAERAARIEAERQADRDKRLASEPRQLVETSARRLAKLLRRRLGDDFDAFMNDLKLVDFRLFKIEVARIPVDEQAEVLHREQEARRAALLAAASELPTAENDAEAEILRRHGFLS